jgi:cell shape-determining protein MreC
MRTVDQVVNEIYENLASPETLELEIQLLENELTEYLQNNGGDLNA